MANVPGMPYLRFIISCFSYKRLFYQLTHYSKVTYILVFQWSDVQDLLAFNLCVRVSIRVRIRILSLASDVPGKIWKVNT